MTKTKISFIGTIRIWGILFLIVLGAVIIALDLSGSYREAQQRAEQMRADYIEQQRQRIRCEVERVAKLIDYETSQIVAKRQSEIKTRVYEAYAIADNIYQKYNGSKSPSEIRQLIINAVRPIRYDNGDGYFFITGLDGTEYLFADRPDLENTNMLNVQDAQGNYVIRDMINIARESGEGFYLYRWTKPYHAGDNHRKVSYVKRFEVYDWFIGSGAYLDGIEDAMHKIISQHVETHRFGPQRQGYVFILDLLDINGGKNFAIMYANPNRPDIVGQYVSDDLKDAKGKMFRKEFLKGLREHGECYVDYWYKKFDQPDPSPKTSFFKLAAEGRFIVAAGVYLDDVEDKILAMQAKSNAEIRRNVLVFSIAVIVTVITFVALLNWLSRRLKYDFSLFADFFGRAAYSSEAIEHDDVRFVELDQLAGFANQMLEDKAGAQKALYDEREQLLVTLNAIIDGVITVDHDGHIELMNQVAQDLTGWAQDETAGKGLQDIFKGDFSENFFSTGQEASAPVSEDVSLFSEYMGTLVSKNGTSYQVSASSAPIFDASGAQRGRVIVFRDETERLRTEEELFNAKKLESVGLLAGGIAHDFNNILSGLFGNIELAKRKIPEDHEAAHYLKMAHGALERATGLTKQLLTFAKGGDPVLEAVGLQQVIDNIIQFNLSGSRVKADIKLPDDLWPIKADRGQLGQVIGNLTLNAKHAMPMGGTLRVTAENVAFSESLKTNKIATDCIKLQIADEGIGMTADVMDKIFDPYFTTKHSGSGLGLATVRSIIDKHNGHISVSSRVGKGTVFTLYLPADRAIHQNGTEASGESEAVSAATGRILVVDDDKVVQAVLSEMLQILGYAVDIVDEGEQAIDRYVAAIDKKNPYAVVIMDLTIPGGMGGKEATACILSRDPHAKVIATSGYSTDPIMAHFEQYRFSGRIIKPFQLEDVRKELSRVLTMSVKG